MPRMAILPLINLLALYIYSFILQTRRNPSCVEQRRGRVCPIPGGVKMPLEWGEQTGEPRPTGTVLSLHLEHLKVLPFCSPVESSRGHTRCSSPGPLPTLGCPGHTHCLVPCGGDNISFCLCPTIWPQHVLSEDKSQVICPCLPRVVTSQHP